MILDCFKSKCPNNFRNTCGMQTNDDFRCKDRTCSCGERPDKNSSYTLVPKLTQEGKDEPGEKEKDCLSGND